MVAFGLCKEAEIGQILHPRNKDKYITGVIDPVGLDVQTDRTVVFPVSESGFYMVYVHATRGRLPMSGYIQFNNPYGFLPAIKYPQLLATIFFFLVYLTLAVTWLVLLFKYRDEIIAIQKHIAVLIGLLCLEHMFAFSLLMGANNSGEYNYILRWAFFLTNAVKFTSMLFLALAVAKGYGIVVPRLGDTLKRMYTLAGIHFISSLLSLSESLSPVQTSEDDVLLYNLPVVITTAIFLIWILRSLRQSIQTLSSRKQNVKLELYQKLTRIITISVVLSFLITLYVMYTLVSHRTDPIWLGENWDQFWFLLDGWPMFLFFSTFMVLLYYLRPKRDNRRYGLEELPTTDIGLPDIGATLRSNGGMAGVFSSHAGGQHIASLHEMGNPSNTVRKPFDSTLRGSSGSIPSYSFSSSGYSTPAASKGNLPSFSSNLLNHQSYQGARSTEAGSGSRSPQVTTTSVSLMQVQEEEPMIHMMGEQSKDHFQRDDYDDEDMQPFVSAPTSRVTSPMMPGVERPASLSDIQDKASTTAVSNVELHKEEPNVWDI